MTVSDEGKGFDLTAAMLATAGIPSGGILKVWFIQYTGANAGFGWMDHLSSNQPRDSELLQR